MPCKIRVEWSFSEHLFFVFFLWPCVFGGYLPFLLILLKVRPALEVPQTNSLHVKSCFFWLVFSVLGSGLTTSLFSCLLLFFVWFSRDKVSGLEITFKDPRGTQNLLSESKGSQNLENPNLLK